MFDFRSVRRAAVAAILAIVCMIGISAAMHAAHAETDSNQVNQSALEHNLFAVPEATARPAADLFAEPSFWELHAPHQTPCECSIDPVFAVIRRDKERIRTDLEICSHKMRTRIRELQRCRGSTCRTA